VAERRARQLLADAHRDFEVRVQQLKAEAEAESKRQLERVSEKTKAKLQERASEIEAELQAMEERARKGTSDAVHLVVSWVKGEEA
jgi:hypothetical protein